MVWYKYLNVNLVFSHLGFWSGNLFLIASFPDRCLLVIMMAKQNAVDSAIKLFNLLDPNILRRN